MDEWNDIISIKCMYNIYNIKRNWFKVGLVGGDKSSFIDCLQQSEIENNKKMWKRMNIKKLFLNIFKIFILSGGWRIFCIYTVPQKMGALIQGQSTFSTF